MTVIANIWHSLVGWSGWPIALWVTLNVGIILGMTGVLILRDLSTTARPFDVSRILLRQPFLVLVFLQSAIVGVALLALVHFGRATPRYGADALWVALAGLSVLKTLPGVGRSGSQQVWSLADWLFQRFYRELRLIAMGHSEAFGEAMRQSYKGNASGFLKDVQSFVSATQSVASATKTQSALHAGYSKLTTDPDRLEYLADWIAPRATQKQWKRLKGQ